MGEAKRRREQSQIVYRHTSTLRTNLLWMSGVLQIEGQSKNVIHPQLGKIETNATLRRPLLDFPPLVWFSSKIEIPRCLIEYSMIFVDNETGEKRAELDINSELANAIALHRVALGFDAKTIGAVPWPQHYGYKTEEGAVLNESARQVGDNPDDWYVTEEPVDLLKVTEFWSSRTKQQPKMEKHDRYVQDIHKMVAMCRNVPGVFIPPTWLTKEQALEFASKLNVPVASF